MFSLLSVEEDDDADEELVPELLFAMGRCFTLRTTFAYDDDEGDPSAATGGDAVGGTDDVVVASVLDDILIGRCSLTSSTSVVLFCIVHFSCVGLFIMFCLNKNKTKQKQSLLPTQTLQLGDFLIWFDPITRRSLNLNNLI